MYVYRNGVLSVDYRKLANRRSRFAGLRAVGAWLGRYWVELTFAAVVIVFLITR